MEIYVTHVFVSENLDYKVKQLIKNLNQSIDIRRGTYLRLKVKDYRIFYVASSNETLTKLYQVNFMKNALLNLSRNLIKKRR